MTDTAHPESAGSETQPPPAMSTAERHLEYAVELLRSGQRPTLDLLVSHNGGSRTTAQQALNALWTEHLPALLLESDSESTLPDSVRSALVSVWTQALREARELAEAALTDEKSQLSAARATLESQLQSLQGERVAAQEAVEDASRRVREATEALEREREARRAAIEDASDARERAEGLAQKLADASQALSDSSAALARLESEREREREAAQETIGRVEAAAQRTLAAAREDAAAMRADLISTHEKAVAALKDAYVDSEARLRVEIDAQKTRAAQLERERDKLRGHNDELMARSAELEAELAKARSSRRPWMRNRTTPRGSGRRK